ncbi:MAG TPA: hypothetical protein VJ794_00595 [Gemmatimonadales bacterium]|nr:hypothetical protein [Gemmatimonadales bacterium]
MSQQPTLRPALGPLALTMLGAGAVVAVDPATRVVTRAGRPVPLRPKEYGAEDRLPAGAGPRR